MNPGAMPAKAKGKHNVSALSKAVKTFRHTTPAAETSTTKCLDVKSAAATATFTTESMGLESAKRVPAKQLVKTVLAGESGINVDRRIRNASVPIGCAVDDLAEVQEELTLEGFDLSKRAKSFMPRRPAWSYEISSGRLHHREVQGFKQWLTDVRDLIVERGGYPPAFEQNLQVWRQLWRVLERCDVAVVVADVRHPLLHLPPALVYHVSNTLRKPLVLVLNKLDAVDPREAARWADYLQRSIPGVSAVVGYSKESVRAQEFAPLPVGRAALISRCHRALEDHLASMRLGPVAPKRDVPPESAPEPPDPEPAESRSTRIMLGMVGHPNVGKSSLVNSIMGGKVVSVKATPGHTKTLQTLILDESTELCDSPGVVFPRLEVPREAQIVGMLIPLAQVREPFSAIRWVMEHARVPLHSLLGLKPVTLQQVLRLQDDGTDVLQLEAVEEDSGFVPWSPMLLCAQYAIQRGLRTSGRPDCLKAGMEILERVLDGRIPYAVSPPEAFDPTSAKAKTGGDDCASDSGSDHRVDEDYESAEEEPKLTADGDTGLMEAFGVEQKGPGLGTRYQRHRTKKREKLKMLEEGIDPRNVDLPKPKPKAEEE